MKRLLLSALLALVLPAAASARTLDLPSGAPVATVTLPDGWNPEETSTGVQATSDDNGIYVALDVAKAAGIDAALTQTVDFLTKAGVTLDQSSMQRQESELNGMKMLVMAFKGKDKEGDANVAIILLIANPQTVLIMTYWGSDEAEKKHGPTLTGILQSIKKKG